MRRSHTKAAAVLTTAILAVGSAASAATDNTWAPKDPKNDYVYTGSKADQKANEKKFGAALAKGDVTARFRYNSARHEFVSDVRILKDFKLPKDAGAFYVDITLKRPNGTSKVQIFPLDGQAITSVKGCRPEYGRGKMEPLTPTETTIGYRVTFPRDCLARQSPNVKAVVSARSILLDRRKRDSPVAYDVLGRGSDSSATFLLD